ncbi:hypothetical protein [Frankia sp. Cppng1_Ct_nod]|uniref:hypothetical protein n=1 Tax=Frankia sp. Cppng1_Ct_nod TaxID=2897162 RepID=UPI00104146A9|nr:hypothetical protein [Frankia sp. Cppng1_Ct_nod]
MTIIPPWVPLDQRPQPDERPTTRGVSRKGDAVDVRRLQTSNGGRRERWALAALHGECADIAAMPPDSGRNHALNGAAYKLGRLVAGGLLDEQDVHGALVHAGVTAGLSETEASRTVMSGLAAGMRSPRTTGGAG